MFHTHWCTVRCQSQEEYLNVVDSDHYTRKVPEPNLLLSAIRGYKWSYQFNWYSEPEIDSHPP
jgi:hypothetical protein